MLGVAEATSEIDKNQATQRKAKQSKGLQGYKSEWDHTSLKIYRLIEKINRFLTFSSDPQKTLKG